MSLKKLYLLIIAPILLIFLLTPQSAYAVEERLVTFEGIEILHNQQGVFFNEVPYIRLNDETVLVTFESIEQLNYYEPIIQQSPFVLHVEENKIRTIEESILQDISTQKQWWKSQVDALDLDEFKSPAKSPVQIAVIDSGVDSQHESLQHVILPHSYDFTTNSYTMTDYLGHGTAIAGIIAATGDNPYQIEGIAKGFPIYVLSLRVMDENGKTKISKIVEAIDYAISQNVQIINLSFGGDVPSWSEKLAIDKAREAGIIVVASAGNTAALGNPINYPANYEGVIAVGAVDENQKRARFSNYHPYVSFTAPGTSILTTMPGHQYKSLSGTSFATPMVSSTLGMLLSIEPSLTEEQLIHLLKDSAIDLSGKGRDEHFGFGLLQVRTALEKTKSLSQWKVAPLTKEIQLDQPSFTSIEIVKSGEYGMLLEEGMKYFSGVVPYLSHSTNPEVATIDSFGNIHAHKYGHTMITVYSNKKDSMTFQIKVTPDIKNKIALFSDFPVHWESDNLAIASVDSYGIVTFHRSGNVNIYAQYKNQEKAIHLSAYSLQPEKEDAASLLGQFAIDQDIQMLFNEEVAKLDKPAIILSFDPNGKLLFTDFTITHNNHILILEPHDTWPGLPLYVHFDNIQNHKGEKLHKETFGYFTFYSLDKEN